MPLHLFVCILRLVVVSTPPFALFAWSPLSISCMPAFLALLVKASPKKGVSSPACFLGARIWLSKRGLSE